MHITAVDQPRARFDVLLVRSVSKELVYITMCTLPLNAILTTLVTSVQSRHLQNLSFELHYYIQSCRLGGIVVSVPATGPKGCGFEPGQDNGILRAIKIRSTNFF
jgi:hypothetical protein